MPAIIANASNMLLSTDYPLDKVVYQTARTVSIPAFDDNDITVPHGLGFAPLVHAQWSTDAAFTTTYSIAGGPRTGSSLLYPTAVSADSTNIYVGSTNRTASPVSLYYRIYALMPSDVNADVGYTASSADMFTLDTGYNYCKLYMSGKLVGPSSGTATQTVTHSLGYRPQIALWQQAGGIIFPYINNNVYPGSTGVNNINSTISNTSLNVRFEDAVSSNTVHYRIYADAMP